MPAEFALVPFTTALSGAPGGCVAAGNALYQIPISVANVYNGFHPAVVLAMAALQAPAAPVYGPPPPPKFIIDLYPVQQDIINN